MECLSGNWQEGRFCWGEVQGGRAGVERFSLAGPITGKKFEQGELSLIFYL